ncbi:MAG: hypothetical protein PHT50_07765 [Candidatus Omnitrophica bacterium]|nr:hypothetical protein [Candidatus Omnitrophota bacterium]
MRFSRDQIIKSAVMLVFLCCMLYANFIAVRMVFRYGAETYLYDKFLVAYTIGGARGLKMELGRIPLTESSPLELRLAKDFSSRLGELKDPAAFLKAKVEDGKSKVNFIRSLRSAAIVLMIILFGWQAIVNFINRPKLKKSA